MKEKTKTPNVFNEIKKKCSNCGKTIDHFEFFYEEEMLDYFDKRKRYRNGESEKHPKYPDYHTQCSNCKYII